MINFKKLFSIKIISLVVAVTFFVTSTSYGIDISDRIHLRTPLLSNSNEGTNRLKQALSYQLRQMLGQVVKSDTTEDLSFYGETRRALLLEGGKILLNEELYNKYNSESILERTEALQTIIHETIEALLQVIKAGHSSRYRSMKELALNHLVELYFALPQSDKSYRDEILANDIWAIAFEYRLMGVILEDIQDTNLRAFLKEAYEIIDARGSLFGEEFSNIYRVKETVINSIRRGMTFVPAAAGVDDVDRSLLDEEIHAIVIRRKLNARIIQRMINRKKRHLSPYIDEVDRATGVQVLSLALAGKNLVARRTAEDIAQRVGENLGHAIAGVILGDRKLAGAMKGMESAAEQDIWKDVQHVVLGGGVLSGEFGHEATAVSEQILNKHNLDVEVELSEWGRWLNLVGLARSVDISKLRELFPEGGRVSFLVADFGKTMWKPAVVEVDVDTGKVVMINVLESVPVPENAVHPVARRWWVTTRLLDIIVARLPVRAREFFYDRRIQRTREFTEDRLRELYANPRLNEYNNFSSNILMLTVGIDGLDDGLLQEVLGKKDTTETITGILWDTKASALALTGRYKEPTAVMVVGTGAILTYVPETKGEVLSLADRFIVTEGRGGITEMAALQKEIKSPDVDAQGRDENGKFTEIPGKSPEYMRDFVATHYGNTPFTIAQYIKDWEIANPGRRLPQSTAYSDLTKARANGWIEKREKAHYRLTDSGSSSALGCFGVQVSQDIYVVSDVMIDTFGGSNFRAIHVDKNTQPLSLADYERFLEKLGTVSPSLHNQLMEEPDQGFQQVNLVYFTPGHILLRASRTKNPESIRDDLRHEYFEQMLRMAPLEEREAFSLLYERLYTAYPDFTAGIDVLFGELEPYADQIGQEIFWADFWTYVAWPDFLGQEFSEDILRRLSAQAQTDPIIARSLPVVLESLQGLREQSERAADLTVSQLIETFIVEEQRQYDLLIPEAQDSNIKLAMFDVGGVLFKVDFRRSVEKLKEFCPNLVVEASEQGEIDDYIYSLFSDRQSGYLGYLLESGRMGPEEFFQRVIDVLKREGVEISLRYSEFIEVWNEAYEGPIEENIALFKTFILKGYTVYVLSNNNPLHKELVLSLLEREGISFSRRHFISSHELRMLKGEDTETFEQVLKDKRIGVEVISGSNFRARVSPEEIIFFDDSLVNVRMATSANINALHYTGEKGFAQKVSDVLMQPVEKPRALRGLVDKYVQARKALKAQRERFEDMVVDLPVRERVDLERLRTLGSELGLDELEQEAEALKEELSKYRAPDGHISWWHYGSQEANDWPTSYSRDRELPADEVWDMEREPSTDEVWIGLEQVALGAKVIAVDFGRTLVPTNARIIAVDEFLLNCLSVMELLLVADSELRIYIISGAAVRERIEEVIMFFPSRFHMLSTSTRFRVSETVYDKGQEVQEILHESNLPESSVIAIGDSEENDRPMALSEGYFVQVYPHTRSVSPNALDVLGRILDIKGQIFVQREDIEDQDLGAMGKFFIKDASYDHGRSTLSVRLIDMEKPQRNLESVKINAQRAPPGLINETLQQLMVMSTNPMVGRIIRWYTDEFVRSGDALILEDNKRDLLGLGKRNIIAVSRHLINNPVALFHEIAHAYFDAHPNEIARIERQLAKGRLRWVNSKDQSLRTHYVLRAFQRQIFKEKDRYLTQLINNVKETRESVSRRELFYLGDNLIELKQLIPLAEALESALGQIDDERARAMLSGGFSVDAGGYSIDNPGEHLLDIVIRDETGSKVAAIKVWPLKQADGVSYDKKGVFLEWFGIEPSWMKGRGVSGPTLYQALARFLHELGYEEIYANIKWGSDDFWENMGFEPAEESIYIPGSIPGFYIEKPGVIRGGNCPTIAQLHKGIITDHVAEGKASMLNIRGLTPEQHDMLNQALGTFFVGLNQVRSDIDVLGEEELGRIDPEGVLGEVEDLRAYRFTREQLQQALEDIDALPEDIEYIIANLIAHPGRFRDTKGIPRATNLFILDEHYNILTQLESSLQAQWARHERAHLDDITRSEQDIQIDHPIDSVVGSLRIRIAEARLLSETDKLDEYFLKEVWPDDLTQKIERIINGRPITTIFGKNFLFVGRFLFITQTERGKHKDELQDFKDSVIICNLSYSEHSPFLNFEWGINTLLAVQMLQAYEDEVRGKTLLDAGSGSDAVLGMVAHRLGTKQVFCVEGNGEKARGSRTFLEINGIDQGVVRVVHAEFSELLSSPQLIDKPDIVIANLSYNGFYAEDRSVPRISDLEGLKNWHSQLARRFSPELYFLCGAVEEFPSRKPAGWIEVAKGAMDEAGYKIALEESLYRVREDESTTFVLEPAIGQTQKTPDEILRNIMRSRDENRIIALIDELRKATYDSIEDTDIYLNRAQVHLSKLRIERRRRKRTLLDTRAELDALIREASKRPFGFSVQEVEGGDLFIVVNGQVPLEDEDYKIILYNLVSLKKIVSEWGSDRGEELIDYVRRRTLSGFLEIDDISHEQGFLSLKIGGCVSVTIDIATLEIVSQSGLTFLPKADFYDSGVVREFGDYVAGLMESELGFDGEANMGLDTILSWEYGARAASKKVDSIQGAKSFELDAASADEELPSEGAAEGEDGKTQAEIAKDKLLGEEFAPLDHPHNIANKLNDWYYQAFGGAAFRKTERVGTLEEASAKKSAEEFYDTLKILDSQGSLLEEIVVQEWGAGDGYSAAVFLSRLKELDEENGTSYYQRLRYVLIDKSSTAAEDIKTNPYLLEHARVIDTRVMDVLEGGEKLREILLIRANSLLNSLPKKMFKITNGDIYELYTRPYLDMDEVEVLVDSSGRKYGIEDMRRILSEEDVEAMRRLGREFFRRIKWEERYEPITSTEELPYGEYLESLVRDGFEGSIALDLGALTCLNNMLIQLSSHGSLRICDAGAVEYPEIGEVAGKLFRFYGAIYSPVNFHFLNETAPVSVGAVSQVAYGGEYVQKRIGLVKVLNLILKDFETFKRYFNAETFFTPPSLTVPEGQRTGLLETSDTLMQEYGFSEEGLEVFKQRLADSRQNMHRRRIDEIALSFEETGNFVGNYVDAYIYWVYRRMGAERNNLLESQRWLIPGSWQDLAAYDQYKEFTKFCTIYNFYGAVDAIFDDMESFFPGLKVFTVRPDKTSGPSLLETSTNELDIDTQGRDGQGRFAELPGKSPEYMRDFVATHYGDSPFTIAQYIKDWEAANPGRRLPRSTAYSDLRRARANGWIEGSKEGAHLDLDELMRYSSIGGSALNHELVFHIKGSDSKDPEVARDENLRNMQVIAVESTLDPEFFGEDHTTHTLLFIDTEKDEVVGYAGVAIQGERIIGGSGKVFDSFRNHGYMGRAVKLLLLSRQTKEWFSSYSLEKPAERMYQRIGEDSRFIITSVRPSGYLLRLKAEQVAMSELQQTVVLFSGDEAQDNLDGFRQALDELDETNTAVVIVDSEEQQRFFIEHRGELGRFYIRTPGQLGLASFDLEQVMTTIMGIDNLRCVPLTDSLCDTFESLKQARGQV
ncbi:hypothetical protein ACFL0P_00370 [Candidatus Omnitrophota bacterium]